MLHSLVKRRKARLTTLVQRTARGSFANKAMCYAVIATSMHLVACTSAIQVATGKVAEVALSAIGVKLAERPQQPKVLSVRIEGANDLNTGSDGQGLSTVVRLYKLRNHNSFLTLPYSSFGAPEKEKQGMGNDLLEVRELVLSPGQTLDIKEQAAAEVAYIGVVALFRSPYPQRWRFAFPTAGSEEPRITLGVHACAMTSTNAAPIGIPVEEAALLTPVKCNRNLL